MAGRNGLDRPLGAHMSADAISLEDGRSTDHLQLFEARPLPGCCSYRSTPDTDPGSTLLEQIRAAIDL